MRSWIPEFIAAPLLPLLIVQGRRARRRIPRLPEARGSAQGCCGPASGDAQTTISLLAVGESPVAGVGVETHEQAITAAFARALAARTGRRVSWQARGINGITAAEALEHLLPALPSAPVDIALVAFGVNDTTAFRPVQRWLRDMTALLDAIDARCNPSFVIVSGVPPMARFPALPEPLRTVLGLKARALDRALRRLAASRFRTSHVPLVLDPADPALMSSDGYHPSAAGCQAWADVLAQAAAHGLK